MELFKLNEQLGDVVVCVVGDIRDSVHIKDKLFLVNTTTSEFRLLPKGCEDFGGICDIAWSYLDDKVLAVTETGCVGVFPVFDDRTDPDIWHDEERMTDIASARTMSIFASGSSNGVVQFWDLRSKLSQSFASCDEPGTEFNHISFSPDDLFVQCSMEDSRVLVFDTRMLSKPMRVLVHDFQRPEFHREEDGVGVTMSRWSKQGFLFTCGGGGTYKVWDVRRAGVDSLLKTVHAHYSPVSCVDISPDGATVVSGCDGNRIALHSIAYDKQIFPPITERHDPLASQLGPLRLP